MTKQAESVAHPQLVGGASTTLHSHPGGGGGGLIDKSGVVTMNASGEAAVTFTTPYGSTNYVVLLTAERTGDTATAMVQPGSKSVNGFTVMVEDDGGKSEPDTIVYWATGPYSNP